MISRQLCESPLKPANPGPGCGLARHRASGEPNLARRRPPGLARLGLVSLVLLALGGCTDPDVCGLITGCEGERRQAPRAGRCVAGSGPVEECSESLCIDETLHLSVTDNAAGEGLMCVGWGGSDACEGNDDYQAFAHAGDQADLYFSFNPEIIHDYSDQGFRRHFKFVWLNIYFPGYDHDFYHQVWAQRDLSYFDSFTYRDGRLKGRIITDIADQTRGVESDEEGCISGDIMGRCACHYELPTHVVIDFDLSVERPGGR